MTEAGDAGAVVETAAARLRAGSHLYFELERDDGGGTAVRVRHRRAEDAALGGYGARFFAADPLTRPFRDALERGDAATGPARVVALGELPWASRVEYGARFGREAGIADVIGLGVPVTVEGRCTVLCFGFHRRPEEASFGEGEKRTLRRLAEGLRLRGESLLLREALGRARPEARIAAAAVAAGLTERERQVARLLAAGHGNGELARQLGIEVATVENHLRAVFAKLGVHGRGPAAARLLGLD